MSESNFSARNAFSAKFPDFYGQSTEFADPSGIWTTDVEIARNLRADLDASQRLRLLEELVADADRMLSALDDIWGDFHIIVNRSLDDRKAVEDWIVGVRQAWRDEIARIRGGRRSHEGI